MFVIYIKLLNKLYIKTDPLCRRFITSTNNQLQQGKNNYEK